MVVGWGGGSCWRMVTVGVRFGSVNGSNAHREPRGALRGSVGEQLGRLSSIDIAHWWGLVEYSRERGGTMGMG